MAHPKTVKLAVVIQGITAFAAAIAIVISTANFSHNINELKTSRIQGRYDQCQLLTDIINTAAGKKRDSPKVRAFLTQTGLSDCHKYAHKFS